MDSSKPNTLGQRCLLWFIRGELAWIFLYIFGQRFSEVFHQTIDRVESSVLGYSVLNVTLQVGLVAVASWFVGSRSQKATRIGLGLAILNALLIAGHIVVSLAHA